LRAAPAAAQAEITGSGGVPSGARPTARARVVLLAATADDSLAARLAAELETLGLEVSRAQIDPILPIDDLVRKALVGGARGVVVADGRRTEFWVAEEGSDRVAMRQELEIEDSPAMESVLSLRTVEFLRVSLGLVGRVVTPPVVVPPVVPQPEAVDTRVAFSLLAGVVASTGRLAPFGTVCAVLRVRIAGPVGIELRGLAPFASQQLEGPSGPIATSVWLAGGGLVLAPRTAARVAFDLGAGTLAAMVRSSGTQTDDGLGIAVYGRAAGRIRLSPSWSVRLDVLGGSSAPRRIIITGNRADVTTWGLAFVSALAGIELAI
jgi:hypothetical protein